MYSTFEQSHEIQDFWHTQSCVCVCLGHIDAMASVGLSPAPLDLSLITAEFSHPGTRVTSLNSEHFVSSMLPRSLSPRQRRTAPLAGRHTRRQPVKLPITTTARPARLTGLPDSSSAGWLCSGFPRLWSSWVWDSRRMEGRVQMRVFLWGTAASLLLLL